MTIFSSRVMDDGYLIEIECCVDHFHARFDSLVAKPRSHSVMINFDQ